MNVIQDFFNELIQNQLLSTAFVLSTLGYLFYSFKTVPKYLFDKVKNRFIFTVTIYEYDELYNYFETWFYQNHSNSYRNVEAFLGESHSQNEHKNKQLEIAKYKGEYTPRVTLKQSPGFHFINFQGKKILINNEKEKLERASSARDAFFRHFRLSAFFGKKQIKNLLEEIVKFNELKSKHCTKIYQFSNYGERYSEGQIPSRKKETLFFSTNTKENLFKDLDEFDELKDWYLQRGIPYKRGYVFHGPPGNGKSSLSLAVSEHTKKHIHCLNLNSLESDAYLIRVFKDISENSILLLEDIDAVFKGREPVNEKCKVNFSTLLNCMDGVFYKEGIITILTTNNIEALDPALIRHGRIDKIIQIDNPNKETIENYLSNFYNEKITLSKYEGNFSMSKIQELCIRSKDNSKGAISFLEEYTPEVVLAII